MSIPLGAIFLAGAILSGVTTVLTKKYQKKLLKVMKLTDIVTSAVAVVETSVSKALSNSKIDEEEFNVLQMLYFKTLNELSNIDHKMGAENRNQFEKKSGRDKRYKENPRDKKFMICTLCYLTCYFRAW